MARGCEISPTITYEKKRVQVCVSTCVKDEVCWGRKRRGGCEARKVLFYFTPPPPPLLPSSSRTIHPHHTFALKYSAENLSPKRSTSALGLAG